MRLTRSFVFAQNRRKGCTRVVYALNPRIPSLDYDHPAFPCRWSYQGTVGTAGAACHQLCLAGEGGYDDAMAVEILRQSPASPSSELGPFRKRDYLELPDEPRCELILGRIYVTPSPTFRHQAVTGLLWRRLHEVAQRIGCVAAIAPLDVTLADHSVVQPDVIYVSASRLGIVEDRIEVLPADSTVANGD